MVLLFDDGMWHKVFVSIDKFIVAVALCIDCGDPVLNIVGGQGSLNEVGVQVQQFWVFALWVDDPNEVQCVRLLSASYPYGLVKVKHTLQS
jgi:hypothetical protein